MMNDTMRFFFLAFLFVLLFLSEKIQGQAVSWGDQGNGKSSVKCIIGLIFPDGIIMKIMEEDLGRLLSVFMMVNFGFIFVHLEKD